MYACVLAFKRLSEVQNCPFSNDCIEIYVMVCSDGDITSVAKKCLTMILFFILLKYS